MIALNGPKGLGDAIYLRAVALHLLAIGEEVTVYTRWPAVFRGLPIVLAPAEEVARIEADEGRHPRQPLRNVTACLHCQVPAILKIDKFRLACLQAGIAEPVELKLDWSVRNTALVSKVLGLAAGRQILLYQPLRKTKNTAQELLRPRPDVFRNYIGTRSDHYRVKLGHPNFAAEEEPIACELDLFGKMNVDDVFDLATVADLFVAEDCYLPILAQALDKQFVCIFSRRALASPFDKVRGINPDRSFHKRHLGTAIFDGD